MKVMDGSSEFVDSRGPRFLCSSLDRTTKHCGEACSADLKLGEGEKSNGLDLTGCS